MTVNEALNGCLCDFVCIVTAGKLLELSFRPGLAKAEGGKDRVKLRQLCDIKISVTGRLHLVRNDIRQQRTNTVHVVSKYRALDGSIW